MKRNQAAIYCMSLKEDMIWMVDEFRDIVLAFEYLPFYFLILSNWREKVYSNY